jgi:hypothetical protein
MMNDLFVNMGPHGINNNSRRSQPQSGGPASTSNAPRRPGGASGPGPRSSNRPTTSSGSRPPNDRSGQQPTGIRDTLGTGASSTTSDANNTQTVLTADASFTTTLERSVANIRYRYLNH